MNRHRDPHVITEPIKNMRITLWGMRGSCQFFPSPTEIQEFSRRIAVDAIRRTVQDLLGPDKAGMKVVEILRGLEADHAWDEYQARLGTAELPIYGGETTCVQVETSDGFTIIVDGGSGIRNCAKHLVQHWPAGKPRQLYMLGSHEHLDHRSGLPFSSFCFARPEGFHLDVYGSFGFLNALDERYGTFSRTIRPTTYMDDPIDYRMMSARFRGTELRDPDDVDPEALEIEPLGYWKVQDTTQPVRIGSTLITAFSVYHGLTRCLAFKFVHNGVSFLFCTDHELRHGPDPDDPRQRRSLAAEQRVIAHARDVDLAYMDGQYYLAEYLGKKGIGTNSPVPRIDWGHGCVEDVIERVKRCRVKRCLIGHHDPEREWAEQVEMDRWLADQCKDSIYKIELAKGDQIIDM